MENAEGAAWNEGVGQGLVYDVSDPDEVDEEGNQIGNGVVEAILLKCFMYMEYKDEPEKRNLDAEGNLLPTMIGMIMIDLGDRISETNWDWDVVGPEALELKTESKLKPSDEDDPTRDKSDDNATMDGIAILADNTGGLSAGGQIVNPMHAAPVSSPIQTRDKLRRRGKTTKGTGSAAAMTNPMFAATNDDSDSDHDSDDSAKD